MPAALDLSALKEAFDCDGFVVIPKYLTGEELAALTKHADQVMEGHEYHSDWKGVRKALEKSDDWFRHQLESGPHVPLIAALILDKPFPASAAFFDKPIAESREISQHVDGLGQQDGATIWIALDAADKSNGCLCYVKSSHLKHHSPGDLAAFSEDSEGATCIEALPGDAIIHSARTVHWSRKSSSSDRRRRACSFFYWANSTLGEDWVGKPRAAPMPQNGTNSKEVDMFKDIDVLKGVEALQALDRDWAKLPYIIQMFRDDPAKFLCGLKPKDPEAYTFISGRL